jgi:hypothetical protein
MSREVSPTTITLDAGKDYPYYPAELGRARERSFHFGEMRYLGRDFSNTSSVEINLFQGDGQHTLTVPQDILDRVAMYVSSTTWGKHDSDCRLFAWSVCGVAEGGPDYDEKPAQYTPIGQAILESGDLIAVGTVKPWKGLELIDHVLIKHWGVYLGQGIILNVIGSGGMLAGTPIDRLQDFYPDTETYKVTDYQEDNK